MPNQYTKVPLFLESNDTYVDKSILSVNLSIAVINSLKDILPKDIESIDSLISKVKDSI